MDGRLGSRVPAVSVGLTCCVVTVAWCFALIKVTVWLSDEIIHRLL